MAVRNLAAERHLNEEIFSPGTFKVRNLSVLVYAQGFTLWHYKGDRDKIAAVVTRDYFADAADMLTQGDLIMLSCADGCRMVAVAPKEDGMIITAPLC